MILIAYTDHVDACHIDNDFDAKSIMHLIYSLL